MVGKDSYRRDLVKGQSAKYQILGGFTLSCCGVNIAAHQSGRLTLHQITAVGILANHLITG